MLIDYRERTRKNIYSIFGHGGEFPKTFGVKENIWGKSKNIHPRTHWLRKLGLPIIKWYIILLSQNTSGVRLKSTTMHLWHDNHSINISACGVWGAGVGIQVFRNELHTHIHLNKLE